MAVTFTGAGVATAASGASPQAVTTAAAFAAGDYLVVLMAYDNSGGGGADPMSGTVTVAPASGAVGASVSAQTGINDPGAVQAGLAVRCVAFPVTTAIPTSTSCNVSWSGTVLVRAVAFMKVSGVSTVIGYRTNSGVTGTNTVANTTATLTTPSVTLDEGVLCWAGHENGAAVTGDADTTNGTWSAVYGTFTGTGVAGMAAYFQSKTVTATATQAFNPSGTSSDWITGCLIFFEHPAITQAAYRFFEDGTVPAATPIEATDTPWVADVTAGDRNFHVRIRLQCTNLPTYASTDDYQLQYDKNTSGSWTNVTAGSSNVAGFNSANFAEADIVSGARTGTGTGSYKAGEVSEDGLVDDYLMAAGTIRYTEHLYSLTLKSADLTEGDTLTFRVLRNGATTGFTYTAVPTIDIGGGVPTVTGTAALSFSVTATVDGVPTTFGTAELTQSVETTAAGIRETFGTALLTITGNASATSGGVDVLGTAELIQSATIDVVGTVVAEIVTGTALLTQSVDVTAAGSRFAIVTGTAAITQSVDVTAAGVPTTFGMAALTQSVDVTVAGTVIAEVVTGTAALTQSVAVTVAGTVIAEVVTGTALLTTSAAITVAGTVVAEVVTGTALLSNAVAITAAGTRFSPGGGTALIAIPVAVTVQGTVVAEIVTGTALVASSVAVTAAGARAGTGTALLSSTVTVDVVGTRAGVTAGTALLAGSVAITADGTVVAEVVTGTALIAASVTIVVSVLKVYERAPYTATWSLLYSGTLEVDVRATRDFDYADGWDTNARATVDHDYAHSWELV